MRSLLLASLALIPACLIGTGDISGGDDNQQPGVCGDNVVNTGETCDDGNTTGGDGCSSTCQTETAATPRISGSMNASTLELYNPQALTFSLMSQGGFSGTANVSAALYDATNTQITTATIQVAPTVDLAADEMKSVPITVSVPLAVTGTEIVGTLKIDVTAPGIDPVSFTGAADIKPILTVDYAAGTGTDGTKHSLHGMLLTVMRGTTIRIKNNDTIEHRTHGDGAFPHEPVGGGQPAGTYEIQTIGLSPGSAGSLGCHDHPTITTANDEYMGITVM